MLGPITTFENPFGSVRYLMAPMAGITDTVFRSLIREMGAQVVISELISSEGMVRGGKKTWDLMRFDPAERPVGIQIFGSEVKTMAEAAHIVESEGADFVDINFGCPVKKVVCDGGGAAWLQNPEKLGELLVAIKARIKIPLTIKIRTGWDEQSRNAEAVVAAAARAGVAWVAIHGRTRAQGYTGLADWEFIRGIAQRSAIPVIGNGDILSAEEARERIAGGYAHAVMIGRGALKNPWIFQEVLRLEKGEAAGARDLWALISRHFELAIGKKDSVRAFLSLKKFMGWYAAGLPYASQFRSQIFGTHDVEELRSLAYDFFQSIDFARREIDRQPFLMGGHG